MIISLPAVSTHSAFSEEAPVPPRGSSPIVLFVPAHHLATSLEAPLLYPSLSDFTTVKSVKAGQDRALHFHA